MFERKVPASAVYSPPDEIPEVPQLGWVAKVERQRWAGCGDHEPFFRDLVSSVSELQVAVKVGADGVTSTELDV